MRSGAFGEQRYPFSPHSRLHSHTLMIIRVLCFMTGKGRSVGFLVSGQRGRDWLACTRLESVGSFFAAAAGQTSLALHTIPWLAMGVTISEMGLDGPRVRRGNMACIVSWQFLEIRTYGRTVHFWSSCWLLRIGTPSSERVFVFSSHKLYVGAH